MPFNKIPQEHTTDDACGQYISIRPKSKKSYGNKICCEVLYFLLENFIYFE